jgi:hypothetical protein
MVLSHPPSYVAQLHLCRAAVPAAPLSTAQVLQQEVARLERSKAQQKETIHSKDADNVVSAYLAS